MSRAFFVIRGLVFGVHGSALTLALSRLAGEGTRGGGRSYFFVRRRIIHKYSGTEPKGRFETCPYKLGDWGSVFVPTGEFFVGMAYSEDGGFVECVAGDHQSDGHVGGIESAHYGE